MQKKLALLVIEQINEASTQAMFFVLTTDLFSSSLACPLLESQFYVRVEYKTFASQGKRNGCVAHGRPEQIESLGIPSEDPALIGKPINSETEIVGIALAKYWEPPEYICSVF